MPMLLGFKLHALNISHGPETHNIFILSDRFSNFFPFQKAARHFYFYFFKDFSFYLCVHMRLCESVQHMFEGTHGGEEKVSNLLKLDLQAVVSCLT